MGKRFLRLIPSLCIVFLMVSCTSKGFLGVLTTNSILEKRLAEDEQRQNEQLQELEKMISDYKAEVDEIQKLTGQLNDMVDTINETASATRELQQASAEIEQRLDGLPTETLQEMVNILARAINN